MRIMFALVVLSTCFLPCTTMAQETRLQTLDDLNHDAVRLGVVAGDASELVSEAHFPDA